MDFKKHRLRNFLLAFLGIQIAASSHVCEETYTKKFIRQVKASNDAFEKHQTRQEPLKYTITRSEGIDIPLRDLLCLHDTLCDTVAPKAVTIITMRKRDRDASDCKDTIMTNLISAIQQKINDESLTSFSAGNIVITIDFVEDEQMPGYLMLSNADEKLSMIFSKLNTLLIETFEMIIFKTYRQWMFEWFHLYAKILHKPHKIEDYPEMQYYTCVDTGFTDNEDEIFCNTMTEYYHEFMSYRNFESEVSNYKSEFDNLRTELFEFEDLIDFRYFSNNSKLFDSTYSQTYKKYEEKSEGYCRSLCYFGYKTMTSEKNRTITKEAFEAARDVIVKNSGFINFLFSGFKTNDETITSGINEVYMEYYESIGLGDIYDDFCKSSKAALFDKLCKVLEIQKTTKIVVNEKMSIENFHLVCEILDSEPVRHLDNFQSIYIDIGGNLKDPITVSVSDPFVKKSFLLRNGSNITTLDVDTLEVYSKTFSTDRKIYADASFNKQSVLISDIMESVVCSDKIENLVFDARIRTSLRILLNCAIAEEIKKPVIVCLEKSKSRPTGLHRITVHTGTQVTDIYLLDHQPDGEDNERTSVIYVERVLDQSDNDITAQETVKGVCCFNNIQPLHLHDLYIQIQFLQATKANKFKIPNISAAISKNLVYTENYIELKGSSTSFFVGEFFEKLDIGIIRGGFSRNPNLEKILRYKEYVSQVSKKIELEACEKDPGFNCKELDQFVKEYLLNHSFFTEILDIPCISIIEKLDCSLEFEPVCFKDKTSTLNIIMAKTNKPIDPLSQNPLQIIKRLVNNKHKNSALDALSYIAVQMATDINMVPMVIDEMINRKDFSFLLKKDSESQECSYLLHVLQIIGALFEYTEKWKNECYMNSKKIKDKTSAFWNKMI